MLAKAFLDRMKARTRALRGEIYVLYLALRHPQTPWYAKALAVLVVTYALSPFDLIPDPIPVIGYLDDIILVPLGVLAVRRLIPASVMDECRATASAGVQISSTWRWLGGSLIICLWLLCTLLLARWCWTRLLHAQP